MNKLYSILIAQNPEAASGWYKKMNKEVTLKTAAASLLDSFIGDVPKDSLAAFACFVCHSVLKTGFGPDILELDPINTYTEFVKQPGSRLDSVSMSNLFKSAKNMDIIAHRLDTDIRDRLSVPEWIEYAAAICLQLLRWSETNG